jgi:hypothetical protein
MKWVAQLKKGDAAFSIRPRPPEYLSMELKCLSVNQPSIVTLADCTVHNTVGRHISGGIKRNDRKFY